MPQRKKRLGRGSAGVYSGGGSGGQSGLGSLFGGVDFEDVELEPSVADSASKPKFKAEHPVMDFLFNKGRGGARADEANMNLLMSDYARQQDFANQQKFGLIQQNHAKELEAIRNSNSLDKAQKDAAIAQANARVQGEIAVLTQAGVIPTVERGRQFDEAVSPTAIQAAQFGADTRMINNKNAAQQGLAISDAQSGLYPSMVETARSGIRQHRLASQGQEAVQPLINEGTMANARMMPAMARTGLNKESFISTPTGVYNVNTRRFENMTPGAQIQQATLPMIMDAFKSTGFGGSQPIGGNVTQPSALPPGWTAPISAGRMTNQPQAQQPGDVVLPDGTIIKPDGTRIPPQQR